ncbi:unnamed protein product [Absidia cylindrospora]
MFETYRQYNNNNNTKIISLPGEEQQHAMTKQMESYGSTTHSFDFHKARFGLLAMLKSIEYASMESFQQLVVSFLQVSGDICVAFGSQTRDAYIFCREDKVKLHQKFQEKENPCLEGKDRPLRGPAVRQTGNENDLSRYQRRVSLLSHIVTHQVVVFLVPKCHLCILTTFSETLPPTHIY